MHHRRAVRSDGTSWAARRSVALAVLSLISIVCLVVGAMALVVGATRPATRTSTVRQPWSTSTTFGWSGTTDLPTANDIYPDGRVQSPQPVFLRLLNDITVTADVAGAGAAPTGSTPLTMRATLGDGSGWSRTWALDRTVAKDGSPAHLSAPLQLSNLYYEVAWNQVATGVVTPVTLTLSVDSGQATASSPHLTFSLDRLLLKPTGPLTTTTGGSVGVTSRTVGTVRLAGQLVSVASLRKSAAVLLTGGLILAAAATLADRRRRRGRRSEFAEPVRMDIPRQRAPIEEIAEIAEIETESISL
jgi:hypothetical protein